MKTRTKFFMSFILLGLLYSCNEDVSNEKVEEKTIKLKEMSSFQGAEIGVLEDDDFKVLVPKAQILMHAKAALKDTELNLQPIDYAIIDENAKKYLRIYSKDNFVSTVELIVDENGVLKVGNTVCTSSACASGGGCVPDGLYCTVCNPPGTSGGLTGDCKRSTSGGSGGV